MHRPTPTILLYTVPLPALLVLLHRSILHRSILHHCLLYYSHLLLHRSHYITLYCTAPYCTALHCTALYYTDPTVPLLLRYSHFTTIKLDRGAQEINIKVYYKNIFGFNYILITYTNT